MTKNEFIRKYDAKENFSWDEIESAVRSFNSIDEIEGDEGRWTKSVTNIYEINGRLFDITFEAPLCEACGDFEFGYQPVEVEKHVEKKVIEDVCYIPV